MLRFTALAAALVAALLLGPAPAAANGDCPPLAVTLKVLPTPSKGISAGKQVKIMATLTNTGSAALSQVGLGFYVSNGLCRIKATPRGASSEGNNVYWEGLTLKAGKRRAFRLKAQVAANLTAGTTLTVGAAGFVAGNDCGVEATGGPRTVN